MSIEEKNNKSRTHGVVSIILFILALAIGGVSVLMSNVIIGTCYFIGIPLNFIIISYAYCTKCSHAYDDSCKHFFIGKIAANFKKRHGKYTIIEILSTLIPLAVTIVFAQFFLVNTPVLFFVFWGLIIIAAIEVLLFVCKGCNNTNCFNCPQKK